MANITVIDTIMGAGKTSYIIDHVNKSHIAGLFDGSANRQKFLYVTPLLTEVDRISHACPDLQFRDPVPIHGRKYLHLKKLLADQENIATTHSLFKYLDKGAYEAITAGNYTLVIDEVLTCCDLFNDLSSSDRALLDANEMVYEEKRTRRLRWDHGKHPDYEGKFSSVRDLCDNGNLVVYGDRDNSTNQVILWQFPIEFLNCFDNVYILTYMFEGSPMRSYLEHEGVSFELKAVSGSRETEFTLGSWHDHSEKDAKDKIRSLVNIYEGPLNDIGSRSGSRHPLSSSWFKKADVASLRKLKGHVATYFQNHAKTCSGDNAWTTFSAHRSILKGKGYSHSGCWIALNTKATNDFAHKKSMAYLANRFSTPIIRNFFAEEGIYMNDEVFALSEAIQVIWRTAIRDDKPINLYIPSDRMRGLLKLWMRCNSSAELLSQLGHTEQDKAA